MLSYILTIFSIITPTTGAIIRNNIGGYTVFNTHRDSIIKGKIGQNLNGY